MLLALGSVPGGGAVSLRWGLAACHKVYSLQRCTVAGREGVGAGCQCPRGEGSGEAGAHSLCWPFGRDRTRPPFQELELAPSLLRPGENSGSQFYSIKRALRPPAVPELGGP